MDLPRGWDKRIREFIDYLPARLDQYDKMVLQNSTLKRRTQGVGAYTTAEAIDWSVTGAGSSHRVCLGLPQSTTLLGL